MYTSLSATLRPFSDSRQHQRVFLLSIILYFYTVLTCTCTYFTAIMRYIENYDLREWVKESLRKTIFQKAHALAVQTGCEVLVKLQDITDAAGCQYYATNTLKQHYKISNLRQPGEMCVSGETGMPVYPTIDRAVQSGDDDVTVGLSSSLSKDSGSDGDDGGTDLNGDSRLSGDTAVPMQITMAGTQSTQSGSEPSEPSTPSEQQNLSGMPSLEMQIKSEPGSDLMDLIGLIPGSGDGSSVNIKQEPLGGGGDDKSSDGTVNYDTDDIVDVTPAQQAAQLQQAQAAQQMQMMFAQQQQAAAQQVAMASPTSASFGGASAQLQQFGQQQHIPAAQGAPQQQRYTVPISPKPYQCATCQKAFGSIQLLQKHTQTFHMRAQNVMSQKSRGRGRGARGGRGGGQQRPSMSWQQASPTQSPNRFSSPGQSPTGQQFSPQQQQWMEQVSQAGSPNQPMPQIAQVQTLQSPGASPSGSSPYGQHSPSAFPSPGAGPSRASPQARRQLIGSSPSREKKKPKAASGFGKRFTNPTVRGIMTGILLAPGPVAIHKSVMGLSRIFNVAVTKTKYVSAANKLQSLNFGVLTNVGGKQHIFVKRPPSEVQPLLQAKENCDLALATEYEQRYNTQSSAAITAKIKESLVSQGLVPQGVFQGSTPSQQSPSQSAPQAYHQNPSQEYPQSTEQSAADEFLMQAFGQDFKPNI